MAEYAGLDQYLRPVDLPLQAGTLVSSYQFNSETDRSAVDTVQMRDLSITNAKLGTISASKIIAGTISGSVIYAGTLAGSQITAGTITSGVIYAGTIAGSQITAGTIVASVGYLGTISANQINTGTLTLGGTSNGNGLMRVLDAGGTQRVVIDNTGITINDGSITIKNSGSTTFLDSGGLVSTVNFPFTQVTSGSASQTTTGTAWVDINGITTDIVNNRTQQIFFILTTVGGGEHGDLTTTSGIPACQFRVLAGATQIGTSGFCRSNIHQSPMVTPTTTAYFLNQGYLSAIGTLPSGTTTVKAQFSSSVSGNLVRNSTTFTALTFFKMGA